MKSISFENNSHQNRCLKYSQGGPGPTVDGPERLTLPDALGWMVEEGEDHLIT